MASRRERLLLVMPLLIILSLFLLFPAAFGFLASFTDYGPAQTQTHFVGLDNYAAVVGDSEFGATLRNIFIYSITSIPAQLAIGFLIAFLLREPFRGRGLLRVVLLLPWLISPVANGVMWHFLFSSDRGVLSFAMAWMGLPGFPSPLGIPALALPASIVTDIWRKAPLVTFLVLPGLLSIRREEWEQAILDGASALDQIRHIALPWVRPLLFTIALLLVGDTLGTFDNILVMTGGGPGSRTMMPGLYSYNQAFSNYNWPVGATSAWMIVAAVVLIGLVYLRLLREETPLRWSEPSTSNLGPDRDFTVSTRTKLPVPTRSVSRPAIGWKMRRRLNKIGSGMLLGLIVFVFIIPVVWTVLASLNIEPENGVSPPTWTLFPSLNNYREVGATEPGYIEELLTSIEVAVATTMLAMAVAFLAAYSLARSRFRGKAVLVQSCLILASLPAMAVAIPLNATVRYLHLYDTFLGVTLAEVASFAPLAVYILFGYIAQLSPELEEAARLDGASATHLIRSVVLPMTAAGVGATAVIIFVLSWNQFLVPFVLSTDQVRSIPMAMVDVFKWDRELEWPSVAAAFVASLLPLVTLVVAAHRLLEHFSLTPTQQVT